MKFSEKVKKLRKDMKLSQGELAEKIGVSSRSVAAYEAGTSYPRYKETYDALAAALGVDVNYLRLADLRKGGRLVFTMSDRPNTTRGTSPAAAPYSMSAKR